MFLFSLLKLICISSLAQEGPQSLDFQVHYFNSVFYAKTTADPHISAIQRFLLPPEQDAWISPILSTFPEAVEVNHSLFFRSDDNCTFSPNRALGVDVWQACRLHDYCFQGLADYQTQSYRDAFQSCNRLLEARVNEACHQQGKHLACGILKKFYFEGVSIPGAVYKAFISDQNKQALFLSEVIRLKSPTAKIYFDETEIFRLLESFCNMQEHYLKERTATEKWYQYSKNRHDLIPKAEFLSCEYFQGHRIVKSMNLLLSTTLVDQSP